MIEGKGITPDFPLTLQGDDLVQWAIDYLHNKAQTGVANAADATGLQTSGVGEAVAEAAGSGGGSFLCNISGLSRWSM